jgi:hypothetical protein
MRARKPHAKMRQTNKKLVVFFAVLIAISGIAISYSELEKRKIKEIARARGETI